MVRPPLAAAARQVMAALVATSVVAAPSAAFADAGASPELLALGRVESFIQRQEWEAAATELGRLPKETHEAPAVKQYVRTVVTHLYAPLRERPAAPAPTTPSSDHAGLRYDTVRSVAGNDESAVGS